MIEIIQYPNDILHQVSEEVKLPLSTEDRKLLDEMYQYVKANNDTSVGLSAIQVGVPKRMCAIRHQADGKTFNYKLVNPRIIKYSFKKHITTEGCLSIEHGNKDVFTSRYDEITVAGYDAITNKKVIIPAKGFNAKILQHEIDHMDGILCIDREIKIEGDENNEKSR